MDLNDELVEKVSRFQWLWRKRKHRQYVSDGVLFDTTSGQGRIIALLKIHDGLNIKDMAYLLGINYSSLSELLSKLEKQGYIMRETAANDRRIVIIKLTDKGRAEEQDTQQRDNDIFTLLTSEEQSTFCGYLDRLILALQKELDINDDELSVRMKEWEERKRHKHHGTE